LYNIRFLILFPLSTTGLQQRRDRWLPGLRGNSQTRRFRMQRKPALWVQITILELPKKYSGPIGINQRHNVRQYYDCCPTIHSPNLLIVCSITTRTWTAVMGRKPAYTYFKTIFTIFLWNVFIYITIIIIVELYVFKNNKNLI